MVASFWFDRRYHGDMRGVVAILIAILVVGYFWDANYHNGIFASAMLDVFRQLRYSFGI